MKMERRGFFQKLPAFFVSGFGAMLGVGARPKIETEKMDLPPGAENVSVMMRHDGVIFVLYTDPTDDKLGPRGERGKP